MYLTEREKKAVSSVIRGVLKPSEHSYYPLDHTSLESALAKLNQQDEEIANGELNL